MADDERSQTAPKKSKNYLEAAKISKESFGNTLAPDVERQLSKTLIVNDLVRTFSKQYGTQAESQPLKGGDNEEPSKCSQKAARQKRVKSRRLLRYLTEDKLFVGMGSIGALGVGLSWPLCSYFVAEFINIFFYVDDTKTSAEIADHVKKESNKWSIVFLCFAVALGFFGSVQMFFFGAVGDRFVQRMRKKVFGAMMHQDIAFFDDPDNGPGQLSSVLSADCPTTKGVTGENLSMAVQNIATLVFGLGIGFWSAPLLALYSTLAFLPLIPSMIIQGRLLKEPKVRPNADEDSEYSAATMSEVVTSLRVVAAWGLQNDMLKVYENTLAKERSVGVMNAMVTGLFAGLGSMMMFCGNAASFKAGGEMMMNPSSSLDLVKVSRTILVIAISAQGIGWGASMSTDRNKCREAAYSIFQILDKKPKIDPRDPSGVKEIKNTNLEIEGLKFRYPSRMDAPVFNSVTFSVKEGDIVGLVGASGCGKSTIFEFLLRYYDINPEDDGSSAAVSLKKNRSGFKGELYAGTVKLGGRDVRDYNVKALRDQIGLVSQQPVLFTDTIANNIRWGKSDATLDEVIAAAKKANAHEFISALPNGYDEIVTRGGGNVSGGQKQRIAIARAFIANRKLILLDEITSALDRTNEMIVQKALDDILTQHGYTALVIAHRLSTLSNANNLVVFKPEPGVGSVVAEQGPPQKLAAIPGGIYASLLEMSRLNDAGSSLGDEMQTK